MKLWWKPGKWSGEDMQQLYFYVSNYFYISKFTYLYNLYIYI
jgi:hypothetical protein